MLAIGGVLVFEFVLGGTGDAPADTRPVAYQIDSASSDVSQTLESRDVDSRELNESEVLERGNEEIESQGITFELATSTFTETCEDAVWGDEVSHALADAECTQAAVGGYTSDDHVGLAAIFNLVDADAASGVAEAMTPPDDPDAASPGFVSVPDEGDLEGLGTGFSAAQATVSGHYLVVTWAQSNDPPGADERENLSAPVVALSNFRDPLFRRVARLEDMAERNEEGGGAGGEEAGGAGDPGAADPNTQPEGGAPGGGAPEGGAAPGSDVPTG